MKLYDILLLTLFIVMGSIIFAIKTMQDEQAPDVPPIPVPAPKPKPKPDTSLPNLRLDLSEPDAVGSYGRLSLDEFLAKGSPRIDIRENSPKATVQPLPSTEEGVKPSNNNDRASLEAIQALSLDAAPFSTAQQQPMNFAFDPKNDQGLLLDRVVDMAEASPLQPDSRGCGARKNTLASGPKRAKVRSVGMERQLTDRTSVGVEYVYNDGCYKDAIAPLNTLNMPSDDGVNVRVNMRF